jgi:glycosyltransferase involved in cell wall biosynthesis
VKTKKMRVVMNCFYLLARDKGAGGAGEYIHSLLELLQDAVDLTLICSDQNFNSLSSYDRTRRVNLPSLETHFVDQLLEDADVFYDPLNGMHVPDVRTDKPVVCSIYDLQHAVSPEFLGPEMVQARDTAYGFAIERCERVITLSEAEVSNFVKYWGATNVSFVYLAPYTYYNYTGKEDQAVVDSDFNGSAGYIVYPAIPWPHKNHASLLEAFASLYDRLGPENCPSLVLTGADHTLSTALPILQSLKKREVGKQIYALGFVSSEFLASLISNARMMVFPSLYEGFGIPVIEAVKFRTPVICSPLPALTEVCGDSVSYFRDSMDPVKISEDIETALLHPLPPKPLEYSRERVLENTVSLFSDVIRDFSVGKQPRTIAFRNALSSCAITLYCQSLDAAQTAAVPGRVVVMESFGDLDAILADKTLIIPKINELIIRHGAIDENTPYLVVGNFSKSPIDWRKIQIAVAHLQMKTEQNSDVCVAAIRIDGTRVELATINVATSFEPDNISSMVFKRGTNVDADSTCLMV